MMSSVDHKQFLKSDKTSTEFSQAEGLNRLKAALRFAVQKRFKF
jgi:hypothetical protein